LAKLVQASVPSAKVEINTERPRKGTFEVVVNGTVVLSLENMARPFKKLRDTDIEKLAVEVCEKLDYLSVIHGDEIPKKEEAAPKSKEAAPKSKEAAPKSKEAAPKSKEAAPKSKEAAPKSKEAAPKSKEAAPKSKEAAPKSKEAAPKSKKAAPKSKKTRKAPTPATRSSTRLAKKSKV